MKTREYRVEVVKFGEVPNDHPEGIIYVSMLDGVETSVNFLCPCGCGLHTYLPFGDHNNEGGSGVRRMFWNVVGKILTIEPSIEVIGGCRSHYHIIENKVK